MGKPEFARRLKEVRIGRGMTEHQVDARIRAPLGTIGQLEAGIAAVPDESLVALLAEGLGVFGSELDDRFDSNLNHTARNFARIAEGRQLRPVDSKRLWDSVFDSKQYRGVVPYEIWQQCAEGIASQGEMFD